MSDLLSLLDIQPRMTVLMGAIAFFSFLLGTIIVLVWAKYTTKKKIAAFETEFSSLEKLRSVAFDQRESYAKNETMLKQEIKIIQSELAELQAEKSELNKFAEERRPVYFQLRDEISTMQSELQTLQAEHASVIEMSSREFEIKRSVQLLTDEQAGLVNTKFNTNENLKSLTIELNDLRATLDLYSQQQYFVDYGHHQFPEFLYQSSERYREEIKRERSVQKQMIKEGSAIENNNIIDGLDHADAVKDQVRLMLRTFNIELDMLFGKIKHSNYARTVNRIDALAKSLEKGISNKNIGISLKYIESKLRECTLIFQERQIKKEEQEAEKLARAEIAEEKKAQREYEVALIKAQKEETTYMELLAKARAEIQGASAAETIEQKTRISYLEQKLAEAQAQEVRAKSLAQQTKCGYIYVISNQGSFGIGVYKIGLTRRLNPMDRVKELGDASVPFPFDVHGIIYSRNAPELESKLHQRFSDQRINVVNFRKEFFKVDLMIIEKAINEFSDVNVTLSAELGHNGDYEEAMRMRRESLEIIVE
jgi:hypothetical protein